MVPKNCIFHDNAWPLIVNQAVRELEQSGQEVFSHPPIALIELLPVIVFYFILNSGVYNKGFIMTKN